MARIPTRDLREAEPFNAFFFAPALAGKASLAALFCRPTRRWSGAWSSSPGSPRQLGRGVLTAWAGSTCCWAATKPAQADLDALFALPSAAVTLQAATGLRPTGLGSVCFRAAEGGAFATLAADVARAADSGRPRSRSPGLLRLHVAAGAPRARRVQRPGHRPARGQLLPGGGRVRPVAAVLAGRRSPTRTAGGSPWSTSTSGAPSTRSRRCPASAGTTRWSSRSGARSAGELPLEPDLGRWFPVWGAPGL